MRIRAEQMDVMRDYMLRQFEDRMVLHLHVDFPDECKAQGLGKRDLELLAHQGISDAKEYGVVNEGDVQLYLECMASLTTTRKSRGRGRFSTVRI